MTEATQLINRWNTFRNNMVARFYEILEQGRQATLDSLDQNNYDYYSSSRALGSMKEQIRESIINKLSTTWRNEMQAKLEKLNDPSVDWVEEMKAVYDLEHKLYDELDMWTRITEGQLSLKYYNKIISITKFQFECSQCGAKLNVKKDYFHSQYVTCNYCSAINTFQPETKFQQIGFNVINNISLLYVIEEYKKLREVENLRDKYADDWAYTQDYEKACKTYLERFFSERIKLMPHTAETYDKDLALELKKRNIN